MAGASRLGSGKGGAEVTAKGPPARIGQAHGTASAQALGPTLLEEGVGDRRPQRPRDVRPPLAPVEALAREVARAGAPRAIEVDAEPLAEQLARAGQRPVARPLGFEMALSGQRIGDRHADLA